MIRSLQAIFEKGVLRPLEPLSLDENQQVTVTVSEKDEALWPDTSFLRYLENEADDSIDIEQLRVALAKIPGSLVEDFRNERNDRQ